MQYADKAKASGYDIGSYFISNMDMKTNIQLHQDQFMSILFITYYNKCDEKILVLTHYISIDPTQQAIYIGPPDFSALYYKAHYSHGNLVSDEIYEV